MNVWNLSVWLEVDKTWMQKTINEVKKEFRNLWWDIEKAVNSQVFINLKKEAEITTNTIWWLNEKLQILKWRLEVSEIWSKEFKKLRKEVEQTQQEIDNATWKVWAFKEMLSSIWPMLASVFSITAIVWFWKAIFDLTSKNQQLENSFITLTWSSEKAKEVLQQIEDLAADSPFDKFNLADNTKKLIWFGFAAENSVPIMQVLWNAVAAMWWNEEMLDWLVLALGQIQAKWKLSAEELMQMAERGIPVFDILREQLWLTEEQIWDIWNAWIEAADAIPALLAWMQEKYLWALEAQSNTLQGQLWKIKDEVVSQMWAAGSSMWKDFQNVLSWISDAVKTWLPFILNTFKSVFTWISSVISWVFWFINSILNWFFNLFTSWTQKNISAINVFLMWLQTLWAGISIIWSILKWVLSVWVWVFKDLYENWKVAWSNLMKLFQNAWENMWIAMWNLWPSMRNGLKSAAKLVEDFINNSIAALNRIPWVDIPWPISFWLNWPEATVSYKGLTDWMQELPWFKETAKAFQTAVSDVTSVAIKEFNWLVVNYEWATQEETQTEKKYDMKKLDWIGQAIVDKRAELSQLTEWSEEYKAKQEEILALENEMKDILYKQTKEMKKKWEATEKASSWASKWAAKNKKENEELKKSIKDLEEWVKDLEKSYKDLETWVKNLEKEKETFAKESEKFENMIQEWIEATNDKLKKQQEEYKKSIDLLKEQREEKLKDTDVKFEEKIWKRAAEVDKEIEKIEQKLKDLELGNKNNNLANVSWMSKNSLKFLWKAEIYGTKASDLLKVKELAEELEKVKKEKQEITDLMAREWIDAENIQSSKNVAESSKTYQMIVEWEKEIDKINKDFDKKEAEKLEKLKEEEQKLERIKEIHQKIWDLKRVSKEELEKLENSAEFKKLDKEEQDTIKKLLDEKVKLTEKSDFILDLERKVAAEKVNLSNKTTELLSKDLSILWDNYKKIINQINSAISAQRTLNAMTWKKSWLGSYAEWWYTWDGWKYEEAWIVHKWEYVIPQRIVKSIPSLIPALESLRTWNSTTQNFNTNKTIEVAWVTVQDRVDLELFFDKMKWKL